MLAVNSISIAIGNDNYNHYTKIYIQDLVKTVIIEVYNNARI